MSNIITGAKEINIEMPHMFTPRDYQEKLLYSIDVGYRRGIAVWHRRAGKDKTLINVMATQATQVVGSYYYFMPTNTQGRKIIWDGMDKAGFKFLDHIPQEFIAAKNGTEMKLTLKNGSIIQVVGLDKIDSIVGTNPIGCVFSEYSLYKSADVWNYIRPILVENGGWALFCYTPRGHGIGFKLYNDAKKNPNEWFSELLTYKDTGAITEEAVEAERSAGMPEDLIEQEFMCSFSASQSRQLIQFGIVNGAVERNHKFQVYRNSPVIIGVDVARYGDDRSCILVRKGLKVLKIKTYTHFDTVEMAREVAVTQDEYDADYTFIDVLNMGAGVVDHLRTAMGRQCIEVNAGEKADDTKKYFNKRIEMWDRTKEWLKNADIPNNPELIADLTNPEYEFNNKLQMMLEKKTHMKKRGVASPDVAEALVHAFYELIEGYDDEEADDQFSNSGDYGRYGGQQNRRAQVDETGY